MNSEGGAQNLLNSKFFLFICPIILGDRDGSSHLFFSPCSLSLGKRSAQVVIRILHEFIYLAAVTTHGSCALKTSPMVFRLELCVFVVDQGTGCSGRLCETFQQAVQQDEQAHMTDQKVPVHWFC